VCVATRKREVRPSDLEIQTNRAWLFLLISLMLIFSLSVTSQSLWIDEAYTASIAAHGTLKALARAALGYKTSDAQAPLYLVYMWAWAKVFGFGEYALRASNLPFGMLFVFSIAWTSLRILRRPYAWIVFCLSPFAVFYMNEVRAYLPVMASAAATFAAVLAYFADRERFRRFAPWACVASLVAACGIQMLAAFLIPMLLTYSCCAVIGKRLESRVVLRDWRNALLAGTAALTITGVYYAWTITAGYGGVRGRVGFGNLAFAAYEFMGFGGLGPPRNELRAVPAVQTLLPYWRWLALGVVAFAGVSASTLMIWLRSRQAREAVWLAWAAAAALAPFVVAANLASFHYLGRHLAVFFPICAFLALQLTSGTDGSKRARTVHAVALAALGIVWLISDLRLVGNPSYSKDDYRFAAAFALDEARKTGGNIAWAADPVAARYYGVRLDRAVDDNWRSVGSGVLVANWGDRQVSGYLSLHGHDDKETILVLSKPDLYDKSGAWRDAVGRASPRRIASANSFDIYVFRPSRAGM
jgi:hypothetical protein